MRNWVIELRRKKSLFRRNLPPVATCRYPDDGIQMVAIHVQCDSKMYKDWFNVNCILPVGAGKWYCKDFQKSIIRSYATAGDYNVVLYIYTLNIMIS